MQMGAWMWLQGGSHQFGVELCGNGYSSKKMIRYDGRMGHWECGKAMVMSVSLALA